MRNKHKSTLKILLLTFAFLTAFWAGFFFREVLHQDQSEFPILSEAYQIILKHGYQEVNEAQEIEYGAIRGLIDAYDDKFTYFLEPVQTELNNDTLTGSYGGIGAEMDRDSQGYIIVHPFKESPAVDAGILDGDRIIAIDGIEITPETSIEKIVSLIRGPEGKAIKIAITRPPNYEKHEFSVKRANIPLPSVTSYLHSNQPKMGVIRINVIASSTPNEIRQALEDLQAHGASHFALDLRGNGGGLLMEGVDIARLFLEDGIIIQQQYKGKGIDTFKVKKEGPFSEIPLVILIDGNTASAAEIIAGALQNQTRAPLIGIQSFGKDSIQLVFELQDKSSLHITSAKWWVPELEPPIGESGLLPDIPITTENNENTDVYLDAAIGYFFGN